MESKNRTAVVSIFAATALVLLKLVTGIVTGSLGLISAGIESSGDVIAAVLTFFAIRLSGKPADEQHQYGHGRVENVAALGEAAILVGGAAFIVHQAHAQLTGGGGHELDAAWYVFVVIAVAIAVDVSRTLTSLRTARKFGSAALRSNAFHFGADLIGTVAVLVGMLFVRAGYQRADAFVALFISALILAAAARLVFENVRSLMDTAPPGAEPAVRAAIAEIAAPVALRRLRIREAAGTPFADVVVAIPSTAALAEGHTTATAVEAAVQRALPGADVVVHVEPSDDDETVTDRVLAAALSVPGIREAHNVTVFDVDGATEVSLHVKVPGGYPLAEGHELAAQVEDAIRASAPEVVAVQTHLEPLDPEVRTRRLPDGDEGGILERVMPVIARIAGADPVALRFLTSDAGIVGFITLELDPAESVARAHAIASEVEDALHRTLPELDELVIHTEPRAAS